MDESLLLAGESFDLKQAQSVIAGYCFDEATVRPDPPKVSYGELPAAWRRPAWGYRSYDCQVGTDDGIDIVDIMSPVMLNVSQGFGVTLISDLLAVAPQINEVVSEVDSELNFWDLARDDVREPREPSDSWRLHRAWYLLESVPGAGMTITHKLLHHRWPNLFPLIDRQTAPKLGDTMWLTIFDDLKRDEDHFERLEDWFAGLADRHGGVSLTRLRLYDILLWCRVVGNQETKAADAGRRVLSLG